MKNKNTVERMEEALHLREKMNFTFREMGKHFGHTHERSRQLYQKAVRWRDYRISPWGSLSSRAYNFIFDSFSSPNSRICIPMPIYDVSKDDLVKIQKAAIIAYYNEPEQVRLRQGGDKTIQEILTWAHNV